MFNHNRGLWGYTGNASDGEPLTVQSTGMGGPSAAIVATELAELGASRLIRVGTCGAIDPSLALGDLVIVTEAIAQDGASRGLGANASLEPDRTLVEGLRLAGGASEYLGAGSGQLHAGPVVSTDLFYDAPAGSERRWAAAGALAIEMETAALVAVAERRGMLAASILLVSDLVLPTPTRISEEGLKAGEIALGELAVRALGARR